MEMLGFDRRFALLVQECHLTRTTLLSGFDQLLKANLYQEKDGYFYSAFFNISIGMERFLKLAVVTHHMLVNDYRTPKISELKNEYGHKITTLYAKAVELVPRYSRPNASKNIPELSQEDASIIGFFSEYAVGSRYFNLNEVCEAKMTQSPISQWFKLAQDVYHRHTPPGLRERANLNLFYKMDKAGIRNGFTRYKDESDNLMMVGDLWYRQLVIQKSAPLVIWRIIETLRPIHYLLEAMSASASSYELDHGIKTMVIPHYEDFFYFLLAERNDIKRRKKWMEIFGQS